MIESLFLVAVRCDNKKEGGRDMKKFLLILLILATIVTGVGVERLKEKDPFRGMCPYADVGDFVLKSDDAIFVFGSKDGELGVLNGIALGDNMYDSIESIKFSVIRSPVVFTDYEETESGIKFVGKAGNRSVEASYSVIEGNGINIDITVSASPGERIILREIVKINDFEPIFIRGKDFFFVQGRNVAYGIHAPRAKAMVLKGFILAFVKTADTGKVSFNTRIFVGKDVEELRERMLDLKNVKKYRAVDDKGNPVKYLKIGAEVNGKFVSVTTTDEAGYFEFSDLPEGCEFSVLTEGYWIKSQKPLVVSSFKKNDFVWPPYITALSTNTAYINWRTLKPSPALIEIEGPEYEEKYIDSLWDNFHSFKLKDLKPDTEYTVKIYVGGLLKECKFRTLGSKNYRFVIYGDTRTNPEWHELVAKAISKEKPLFVINVGDLVESGDFMKDWNEFFKSMESLTAVSAYVPVLGNHERNSNIYYQAFMLPEGGGDFHRRWYSFDAGDVHFIILDSNVSETTGLFDQQTEWLISDLEKSKDKKFKLVFFHHPFYTNTPNTEPTHEDKWRWIFEKYGVDAVFNGHIHNYERFRRNGIQYVITGGGGAPLGFGLFSRNRKHLPWSVSEATGFLHYVLAEVKENKITFTVKAVGEYVNGKIVPRKVILDRFEIEKR